MIEDWGKKAAKRGAKDMLPCQFICYGALVVVLLIYILYSIR